MLKQPVMLAFWMILGVAAMIMHFASGQQPTSFSTIALISALAITVLIR